jgi:hypothetical protein
MSNVPQPAPVQLGRPGLYVLPTAVGFAGTVIAGGRLPVRLHFALEDGTEFHLPISDIARERLCTALEGLKGVEPGHELGRRIQEHTLSDDPVVQVNGDRAVVEAHANDGTSLRLSMTRHALEGLRATIDAALGR